MPNKCSVPGCQTKCEKGLGPRLYCIPSDINFTGRKSPLRVSRRKKWIAALKLQHLDNLRLKNIRICGDHFVSGKPANQYFVSHPDWIPSLKLDLKESRAVARAKSEFLNKLQLDANKKSTSSAKKNSHSVIDDNSLEFSDELNKYSKPQKRCCVVSCLNRMSKTKNSTSPIYYHKFPDDPLTRSRWFYLCQKKGSWDPNHCYICSEHFNHDNYSKDSELKPFAVPTSNLFSNNSSNALLDNRNIVLENKSGYCSIPWCKSSSFEQIKMVPFPSENDVIMSWIEKIFGGRVPVLPSKGALICQNHFTCEELTEASGELKLKEGAVPSVFCTAPITSKSLLKKKSESNSAQVKRNIDSTSEEEVSKKKPCVEKRSGFPDVATATVVRSLKNNNVEIKKGVVSKISSPTVDEVKIVKRQDLDDHTYTGANVFCNEFSQAKKSKTEISMRNNKVNGFETAEKTVTSSGISENTLDCLDDYSDYSDSDSASDEADSCSKLMNAMSEKELMELAEAQHFQLDDLKNENKELIEENERLRNELNSLKSDPKYFSLEVEKNKFLQNVVKLFKTFLNVDQILSLVKKDPSISILWSTETLSKASEIHKFCSDQGYDKLIDLGFPLPSRRLLSMLLRNEVNLNATKDVKIKGKN